MSAHDHLTLTIGGAELLHAAGIAVSGLGWGSAMPGGYGELHFEIVTADPTLPVLNELQTDAAVVLAAYGSTIWTGYVLPLEREIGATGGLVKVECEGTLSRAKRNGAQTYTAVDADMGNWWQAPNNNGQFGADNQGQLLLYLNKGSSVIAGTSTTNSGTWYYYVDEGLPKAREISKVTYDYIVDVNAANWYAALVIGDVPDCYHATSDYALKTWGPSETDSGSGSDSAPGGGFYALWLTLYSLADVDTTVATRYVKLTNVKVYTQAAAPTIDTAMYDLLSTAGFATSQDAATLDTLNHCAYRSPMSLSALCADLATHSASVVDWGLYGAVLYCHYRPAATAATTIALRRQDLPADTADTICGDFETALDGVMVLYGTDGTGGDADFPRGTLRSATYGSTSAATNRVEVLDYSGDVMSPTEAAAAAQQEYSLRNANAFRNSVTLRLSQMLVSEAGTTVDPLLIRPVGTYLRRTYMLGEPVIFITGVDCDLDNDTVTLTVGSQEERNLYRPFALPRASVSWHTHSKIIKRKVRGKVVRRKTSWGTWE
jgi:hypothetical protein